MKMIGYTKQERALIVLTRSLAIIFLGLTALCATSPDYTFNYVTQIGAGLFNWPSPLVTLGQERFWLVPAFSLSLTLSVICTIIQSNPARNIDLMIYVLVALFSCTAGFVAEFFLFQRHFVYVFGASAGTILFLISAVVYRSAQLSRNRWS